MDFHDYDPEYPEPDTKERMGVVEAFCWFFIIPVLVLSFLSLASIKLGY